MWLVLAAPKIVYFDITDICGGGVINTGRYSHDLQFETYLRFNIM